MNPRDILDLTKELFTEEQFDAFVAGEMEMLKTRMEGKPDSLMPYLAVKTVDMYGKEGITLCAIAVPFNEAEEKRIALMGIGARMYKEKLLPLAISLTCEAWMARNLPDGVQPRNSPDKRGVAILIAQDLTAKYNKIVCLPVKRDENNAMEIIEEEEKVEEKVERKNVQSPLLMHFFRGFAMAVVNDSPSDVPSGEPSALDSEDPARQ